jgi:septal ring factor EnvC (AmiA/AmiB activator)
MNDGLPGIGPVNEPEENKDSEPTEKKKLLNGWIDWPKIAKALFGLLVLVGGSFSGYQIYNERQPIATDTALAAEIEKVKGDVKEWKAVTTIVQEQVKGIATKTDETQKDVGDLKTATEVLKEKIGNLNEKADKLDKNQEKIQDGINKILQKLK